MRRLQAIRHPGQHLNDSARCRELLRAHARPLLPYTLRHRHTKPGSPFAHCRRRPCKKPVLMGDDEGGKPIIALKKLLKKTRLERDSARATIAEQAKRILTLEEQLAKALKALDACDKADRIFSPSIQKSPDDVKETGTAAPFTPARTTMGRHDRLATSVAKKLMKKQEEGVLASPDTRVKNPKKLPEASPEPVSPPKKEYRI